MPLLPELLSERKKDELVDLAKKLGIPEYYKMKKNDLAQNIADYLLNEDYMKKTILIFSDEEIEMFEKAFEGNVTYSEDNLNNLLDIADSGYLWLADDRSIYISQDVAEMYSKINTEKFRKKRAKYSWVRKCLYFSAMLYGIVTKEVFLKLCAKSPDVKIKESEIWTIANEIGDDRLFTLLPIQPSDDFLYFQPFAQLSKPSELLLHAQSEHEFYIPKRKQIDEFFRCSALLKKEEPYKKVKKFIKKHSNHEKLFVNLIVIRLWHIISMGGDLQEIIEFFKESEVDCENCMEEFAEVYREAHNNTRMIMLRGHTPNEEMEKFENSDLQEIEDDLFEDVDDLFEGDLDIDDDFSFDVFLN